jgi:Lrp/AsnC family leucine-responsive transcriptional regulator
VLIGIKIGQHSKENAAILQDTLVSMPEVVSCHMVSGSADFIAEIVVTDLQEYERLLTARLLVLPMIVDVRSNISLRRIKSEAPLPLKSQEQTSQKPKAEAKPRGRKPAIAARRGRRP